MADWRYQIPSTPPTRRGHSSCALRRRGRLISDGSGVFQSLDNGKTWTLFPGTTYGAVTQGGDLPHVPVTDLDVSLGNVNTNTGMPDLAGPYQTLVFTGTLTNGSPIVSGITTRSGRRGRHYRHRHPGRDDHPDRQHLGQTITLSANATASGSETLAAADPNTVADPDLLLATTYGRGQFAINLDPLILQSPTTGFHYRHADRSRHGNRTSGRAGPITISGTSEISAFGNTTWITVEDVTNPADPIVIAGFNPADRVPVPSASNSTNALGSFNIVQPGQLYMTDGTKTIEIFATDNAGAVGNVVTYTFNLQDSHLPQPPPTTPPRLARTWRSR